VGYRRIVAQALTAHSLLGLVLGALVYQVCLTGTLSVFAAEWKRWEQPAAPVVAAVSPEGFAAAVAGGMERVEGPGSSVVILGPTPDLPRLEVRLPGRFAGWADADGRIVLPAATPWSSFITELHEEFELSHPWGPLLVGLSGVALMAAIGTGVLAHRRIFRDAFRLRLGGSERLEAAELHNRLSVWALPFHAAVAFTGAALGFIAVLGPPLALVAFGGDAARGMVELRGEGAGPDRTPAPLPDIAALIRAVEAEAAPAQVSFILLEAAGTASRLMHIDTGAPRDLASGESYRFRGQGEALGSFGHTDGPADRQIRAALYPLHVGSFGGWPLRVLYGLLGAALCWITASGMSIWFARMRARGTPAPGIERAWAVVLWGQPAALALAGIATLGGWGGPALAFLAATLVTFPMAAAPIRAAALSRGLRLLTGTLLCVLVAVHLGVNGVGGDGAAQVVNLVLAVTGLIFLAAGLRRPGSGRAPASAGSSSAAPAAPSPRG